METFKNIATSLKNEFQNFDYENTFNQLNKRVDDLIQKTTKNIYSISDFLYSHAKNEIDKNKEIQYFYELSNEAFSSTIEKINLFLSNPPDTLISIASKSKDYYTNNISIKFRKFVYENIASKKDLTEICNKINFKIKKIENKALELINKTIKEFNKIKKNNNFHEFSILIFNHLNTKIDSDFFNKKAFNAREFKSNSYKIYFLKPTINQKNNKLSFGSDKHKRETDIELSSMDSSHSREETKMDLSSIGSSDSEEETNMDLSSIDSSDSEEETNMDLSSIDSSDSEEETNMDLSSIDSSDSGEETDMDLSSIDSEFNGYK